METLFRFMMLRPPRAVEDGAGLMLQRDSAFERALKEALESDRPGNAVEEAVSNFINDEARYAATPDALDLGPEFLALRARIEAEDAAATPATLRAAVEELFGQSPKDLVASSAFQADSDRLSDSLIAIKLAPSEHKRPISKLARIFQTMELARRLAENDEALDEAGAIQRVLRATLLIPAVISRGLRAKQKSKPPVAPKKRGEMQDRFVKARREAHGFDSAIDELMTIGAADLTSKPGKPPPAAVTQGPTESSGPATASDVFLKPAALDRLTGATMDVLREAGLDARKNSYGEIVNRLIVDLDRKEALLADLEPAPTMRPIGYRRGDPIYMDVAEDERWWRFGAEEEYTLWTVGELKPIGKTDLLIVEQQLVRYQGGDVAHIENVLQGETRSREHTRTTRTEEYRAYEEETEKEEERHLETTDRFELQRETEETVKRESNLETGLSISASYGSVLQVDSNLDYALENSEERSQRSATEFSREVVDKSVSKFSEKIREKRETRVIEEYVEKNFHGFEGGHEHTIGVYQWVDKVYEAQVFNYGQRDIYDMVVPEPGVFLWEALSVNLEESLGLAKPRPFTRRPRQIRRYNYGRYVKRYQVTDVEPPPEEFIYKSESYGKPPEAEEASTSDTHSQSANVEIPPDYEAIQPAHLTVQAIAKDAAVEGRMGMIFGTYIASMIISGSGIDSSWHWALFHSLDESLPNAGGSLPLGIIADKVAAYNVNLQIKCKCKNRAYREWQLETHTKIMQAYLARKSEYEEKLAAHAIQEGVEITGRNPGLNRKFEKNELKKICISLISQQYFDDFNAIEEGTHGMPQVNRERAEIEGPYIRFFEHAFEWENLAFALYPYFWGRKAESDGAEETAVNLWKERLRFQDADPAYVDFVTAGAARVVVPVRRGFENAVDHFRLTGEIWEGGELPGITDDTYLPMVDEMRERLGAPDGKDPWGEPWYVTVPTSLIRLRPDGSLPRWEKDEHGNWVPDELSDS